MAFGALHLPSAPSPLRPVALGLLSGLIAWHIYGLTDAVALGTKPALVFWAALGLIAALPTIKPGDHQP